MYKLFCRIYQQAFKIFTPLLPWREPIVLEGSGSLDKLPALIKKQQIGNVLIVFQYIYA